MLSNYQKIVIISFMAMFTVAYTTMYLFVYCPSMVVWFGYHEQVKAYYVGVIVAGFFVGGFITNYPFGALSDRYGHRIMLTVLLSVNAVTSLAVGFCQDVYTVTAFRFVAGMCSAILGISRAIVSPFCDDTNHAKGLAINQSGWLLGMSTAAVVSGYFVLLTEKYPDVFSPDSTLFAFFAAFPYFIPPFMAFLFSFISAVVTYFAYPKYSKENYEQILDDMNTSTDNTASKSSTETDDKHKRDSRNIITSKVKKCMDAVKSSTIVQFICDSNILIPCVIYSVFTAGVVSYGEYFSVWASTPRYLGGLSYDTDQVGLVVTVVSIPAALFSVGIFTILERKFGSVSTCIVGAVVMMVTVSVLPTIRVVKNDTIQYILIIVVHLLYQTADGLSISAILVVISNTVPHYHLAAVHGLSRMFCTLTGSVSPLVCGVIFAKSIVSNLGPPIESSLTFVFLGVVYFIGALMTVTVPSHLNHAFRQESEHGYRRQIDDVD